MTNLGTFSSPLFFLIFSGSILFLSNRVICQQQQYFRVQPQDKEVVQGDTAEMQCHIAFAAGAVQWSKDGFVLGYDPEIPGYPRYGMVIDRVRGVYNLRIANVQLQDEGEYECQVGPAPNNNRIWEKANLTVLVPPKKVAIEHRSNASVLEVREAERVPLSCYARKSKPQSELKWFKNGVELKDNVMVKTKDLRNGLFTRSSTITLYPKLDDNNVTYTCKVTHPGLKRPQSSSVTVIVLYPPEPPKIEGYQNNDIVQVGDTLTLACISRGGNPPSKLLWFRNGAQVDSSYSVSGRETTNPYTFHVDASDNNADYRCEASNSVTLKPMVASVRLKVYFPPAQVSIKGPREGKRSDNVTLNCIAGPSNPAAKISWVVDGRPVPSAGSSTESSEGGWITTSRITIGLTWQGPKEVSVSCYALNEALGDSVSQTTSLSIIYPPGPPSIKNFQDKVIRAGDLQRLTCVSFGGNPFATLRWFKGNAEVSGTVELLPKGVSSTFVFRADASDNGAVYRCEASNPAALRPMATSVTLSVIFPPSSVSIKVEPINPKAGQTVVLICESTTSNPESRLQWWRNGDPITGNHDGAVDGLYGGKVSRSRLRFNVTSADDTYEFTCQATNLELQRSVHHSVKLRVLYKPEFLVSEMEKFDAVEGESGTFNVTARGNPPVIDYTWIRNGEPVLDVSDSYIWKSKRITSHRVVSRGPVLEITEVSRNNGGQYVCEASNSQGTTRRVILINVLYEASVTRVSPPTYVRQGDDAHFQCEATGNPLRENVIRWNRVGFETKRMQVISEKGQSFLTVLNVSKEDSGEFECVAYNGIGEESIARVLLLVKFKPVIQKSQHNLQVAGEKRRSARLVCQAEAAPNVSFVWTKDGRSIPGEEKLKFSQQDVNLVGTTWKSTLFVNDIRTSELGIYECTAMNDIGKDVVRIKLRESGKPDPPSGLSVVNVSHNAVLLSWKAGFNGGFQQEFRVRFKKKLFEEYTYSNFIPGNASGTTIKDLSPQTDYVFEIMSRNVAGESDYSEEVAYIKTIETADGNDSTGAMIDSTYGDKGEIPRLLLVVGSVVGALLVFMNVILVICFIRKRKRRRQNQENSMKDSKPKKTDNKMYTPSKYQERINGEALYPVDDKRNGCHDIMMKELPVKKKGKGEESQKFRQKSSLSAEPGSHSEQDSSLVTALGSGDECPDILKPRRTYKKDWPRSSLDDGLSLEEDAIATSSDSRYVPFPVSKRTTLGKPLVQIMAENPEAGCLTRDFLTHTPPLPPRSIVGAVGTHVV
ncbi:nephrin-like isoform X2 [Tachypleus tridentatus]|uniref:nephrin-like isoform X2 n=1 Tax=Tachypleus tridentatus TaxID=6853 RepID=UPI003FD4292B